MFIQYKTDSLISMCSQDGEALKDYRSFSFVFNCVPHTQQAQTETQIGTILNAKSVFEMNIVTVVSNPWLLIFTVAQSWKFCGMSWLLFSTLLQWIGDCAEF